MSFSFLARLIFAAIFIGFVPQTFGQNDIENLISAPKGTPQIPVRFGYVNVNTGNLHLEIPLQSSPQRGTGSMALMLRYDSSFWQKQGEGWVAPPITSLPSFWNLVEVDGLPV